MALANAVKKINEAIKDLSSLHVQTYMGNVEVDLSTVDDNTHAMDIVRDTVKTAQAGGNIELVAEAYYQFDGDSYNFLASGDVPVRALDIHTAAVEAGMKTRRGLVELVKGVF